MKHDILCCIRFFAILIGIVVLKVIIDSIHGLNIDISNSTFFLEILVAQYIEDLIERHK
jgi:hypothetical protein